MTGKIQIRCGGQLLDLVADTSNTEITTVWRDDGFCGDLAATWNFNYSPDQTPPFLTDGNIVQIYGSGTLAWTGILSEPERATPWTMRATGLGIQLSKFPAQHEIVVAGQTFLVPCDVPDEAFDYAVDALGLKHLYRIGSLGTDPIPRKEDDPPGLMLDELLTRAASNAGQYLQVGVDGAVRMVDGPDAVSWFVHPSISQMGIADPNFVTHLDGLYVYDATYVKGTSQEGDESVNDGLILVVRQLDTYVAKDEAAATRWGGPVHRWLDLTQLELGRTEVFIPGDPDAEPPIPDQNLVIWDSATASAAAAEITEARFAKVGARMGYTNGLEVDSSTLQYLNGAPADPVDVRAGALFRMFGILDAEGTLGLGWATDIVLGESTYREDTDTTDLDPVGLVPRDFEGALAGADPDGNATPRSEQLAY